MQPTLEKIQISKTYPVRVWLRKEPVFEFAWHYHPEYELTLITKGHGTRIVGDHVTDYQAGDLVLLGPNLPHTWSGPDLPHDQEHEAYVIQFSSELFGPDWLLQPELTRLSSLLDDSASGVHFHSLPADDILNLFGSAFESTGLQQIIAVFQVFEMLCGERSRSVISSSSSSSLQKKTNHLVDRMVQYVHEHSQEQITLSDAADAFNMTPSTFHRHLKRSTGQSLTQLVNELRISQACSLISRSDLSIAEICFQSGYQNLSYFNRKFLELKNKTPREYRNQFQGAKS